MYSTRAYFSLRSGDQWSTRIMYFYQIRQFRQSRHRCATCVVQLAVDSMGQEG